MAKRKTMITNVVNEVESLASYYEAEIKVLNEEIDTLTDVANSVQEKLISLEKENKVLQSKQNAAKKKDVSKSEQATSENNYDLLFDYAYYNEQVLLEDYLMQHESASNIIVLLKYLLFVVEQDNELEIRKILAELKEHIDLIDYENVQIANLLVEVLSRVFKEEERLEDTSNDQVFITMLNLLLQLKNKFLIKRISSFIIQNFTELLDNILYTNYIKIIIPFLKVCYVYGLNKQLKIALQQITTVEWDFLSSDMDFHEFALLFWYSYLHGVNREFVDALSTDEFDKLKSIKQYKIYFYVSNSKNNAITPNRDEYERCRTHFIRGQSLTKQEKEEVLYRLDNTMKSFFRYSNFTWPSTKLKEEKTVQEETVLKQESDLKSFGYQITGMSQVERWKVLKKAVPALGLYKVAYTIASHVKMRKGQEGGEVKFKHAITQWEYDLARLKSVYYKKDFNWPSTKVRNK